MAGLVSSSSPAEMLNDLSSWTVSFVLFVDTSHCTYTFDAQTKYQINGHAWV